MNNKIILTLLFAFIGFVSTNAMDDTITKEYTKKFGEKSFRFLFGNHRTDKGLLTWDNWKSISVKDQENNTAGFITFTSSGTQEYHDFRKCS